MTDNQNSSENPTPKSSPHTFYEEFSVQANQLVERIEKLIKEGNIRRLIVKDNNGRTLIEIPLTLGVVAGAGVAFYAMPLAILGALAAYVARVKVIIERYENPADAVNDQVNTETPEKAEVVK